MTDDRMTMDARSEAVEVMARAMFAFVWPLEDWDEYELATETTEEIQEDWRKQATAAFDALLSPRTVPCSECGGTGDRIVEGWQGEHWRASRGCLSCGGSGQVSLPPLAVLMGSLEQVGWWIDYEHELIVDDDLHPTVGESWDGPAPVFVRLRSREEEGT